jgi:CMP-N-acetylneuraminic acid synthetase
MESFSIQVVKAFDSGQIISLDVNDSTTIAELKRKIEKEWDLTPSEQNLIFANNTLEPDTQKLSEFGIVENSSIYMVIRLKGGHF